VFLTWGGVGNASEEETLRKSASKRFLGYDPVICGYDEVHPLLEGSACVNPSKRGTTLFINVFESLKSILICGLHVL